MKITTDEFLQRLKIEEVLEKYNVVANGSYGQIATDIAKIFLQPDVSDNEANQPENKKDGEVAVCKHYFVDELINDIYYLKCKKCGKIKNHKQTDDGCGTRSATASVGKKIIR